MKRFLSFLISVTLIFSLFGCNKTDEAKAGGGASEITGFVAYFYGDAEYGNGVFDSRTKDIKGITLLNNGTYKIELAPRFIGSKEAVYRGDIATLDADESCCDIKYIGDENNRPTYSLTVKSKGDFTLKISVEDFTQTINITVI